MSKGDNHYINITFATQGGRDHSALTTWLWWLGWSIMSFCLPGIHLSTWWLGKPPTCVSEMPAGTRSEIVSPSIDINHNGLAVTHQHLSGLYTPFEMLAMLNHAECISRTLMCKPSEYLGHTSKTNPPPKYVPYPFLTASEDKHFWRQGVQWNFFWEVAVICPPGQVVLYLPIQSDELWKRIPKATPELLQLPLKPQMTHHLPKPSRLFLSGQELCLHLHEVIHSRVYQISSLHYRYKVRFLHYRVCKYAKVLRLLLRNKIGLLPTDHILQLVTKGKKIIPVLTEPLYRTEDARLTNHLGTTTNEYPSSGSMPTPRWTPKELLPVQSSSNADKVSVFLRALIKAYLKIYSSDLLKAFSLSDRFQHSLCCLQFDPSV